MKSQDIQVSVCIVTYNQEKYIAECLDSLVSQKTNFKFEIIVGEDCSTDGTRAVIQKYVDQYPELIVPLFYEKNLGPVENLKQVYLKAQGKYIAHMDGDDLALPGKLQKQFDTLEINNDCTICAHNMKLIDQHGFDQGVDHIYHGKGKYSQYDLYIIHALFRHSSKMFLNNIEKYINDLPENTLDIELHIIQSNYGSVYFLDEILGKYRENVGVTFTNKFISPLIIERVRFLYSNVNQSYFSKKQYKEIKRKYSNILLSYAFLCAKTIKDEQQYIGFVKESIGVYRYTFYQLIFVLSLVSPKLIFKLCTLVKLK